MVSPQSVHAHDLLDLIASRKEGWQPGELLLEVEKRFGANVRFHTCSMDGLSIADLLEFVQSRGKVILRDGRLVKEACSCGH